MENITREAVCVLFASQLIDIWNNHPIVKLLTLSTELNLKPVMMHLRLCAKNLGKGPNKTQKVTLNTPGKLYSLNQMLRQNKNCGHMRLREAGSFLQKKTENG